MKLAVGLPVRRARNWYRRCGRVGSQLKITRERHGSQAGRTRTLEDWARFGGGLLASDLSEVPRAHSPVWTERRWHGLDWPQANGPWA